jgi:uncharacterized protein YerC
MAKIKVYEIDEKEKYQSVGCLLNVIAELKSKKEIIDFFMGMLTPSEALMMGRRIQVAKMIIDEESAETIRKKLKVSFQTIAKTDHWLKERGDNYYHWISGRITNGLKEKNTKKFREYTILDKYPGHRILKDLLS